MGESIGKWMVALYVFTIVYGAVKVARMDKEETDARKRSQYIFEGPPAPTTLPYHGGSVVVTNNGWGSIIFTNGYPERIYFNSNEWKHLKRYWEGLVPTNSGVGVVTNRLDPVPVVVWMPALMHEWLGGRGKAEGRALRMLEAIWNEAPGGKQ